MANEELSGEVAVSLAVTESGVTASAKSRLANAVDYSLGATGTALWYRLVGPMLQKGAIAKGQVALVTTAYETAAGQIASNPEAAAMIVQATSPRAARKEENVIESIVKAIEALKAAPPTSEESTTGPSKLSPDMLNRWARYSEDATSDELRERWGQVLAAEIRKPGVFSP